MKNIKQKQNNLWYRATFLELTKFCVLKYAKTKDEEYKSFWQFFLHQAKQYDENGKFKEII